MRPSNSDENISKETVKKRYCINCGKLLELKWKICPYCGVKVWKDTNKDKLTFEDKKISIEKKDEFSTLLPPETTIIKKKEEESKPIKNICPFCGYENELNNIYCHQCGYKFKML